MLTRIGPVTLLVGHVDQAVTPSNVINVSRTILGNIFSYNGSVNFYMFFGGRDKFF